MRRILAGDPVNPGAHVRLTGRRQRKPKEQSVAGPRKQRKTRASRKAAARELSAYFHAWQTHDVRTLLSMPAPRRTGQPLTLQGWILIGVGVTVVVAFFAMMMILLISDQSTIARVLISGQPGHANVIASACTGRGSDVLTLTFVDRRSVSHTVHHKSPDFGCVDSYRVGDVAQIHYVPNDPSTLMTQAEMSALPFTLLTYALADIMWFGLGALALWALFFRLWGIFLRIRTMRS